MNRIRLLAFALVALLVVVGPLLLREAAQAQAGTPTEVTLSIDRIEEVGCDEELNEVCPNDYYPKYNIDLQGFTDEKANLCCAHGTDVRITNWVFKRTVDSSHNPVQIHIEIHDQDDLSGDDLLDIADGSARSLDVTFDLVSCTIQGGGLTVQQGGGVPGLLQATSQGGDADAARITFTLSTPFCIEESYKVDSDGDGLFNGWEITGLDIDASGNVVPVLDGSPDLALGKPPFNANPYRKDLFVEVDWMVCNGGCIVASHSHAPAGGALDDVVKAFAEAPVDNPNGSTGITLHAVADEALPELSGILFLSTGTGTTDDFDDIKLGNPPDACARGRFGTQADRAAPNCTQILAAKRLVFRYAIFGHSYAEGPGSSGVAELGFLMDGTSVGGNDFMVTLGDFSATLLTRLGGQRAAEASTFMHELGHTLALQHGGGDGLNCKPNYLSVMNYTLQFATANTDPNRPMDYTSAAKGTALGALNENGGLNENAGIGGPAGRRTIYGLGGVLTTAAADAASIDWNGINGLENSATADINFISTITPSSADGGCSTASANQNLNGFDDWKNIVYNFRNSPFFADGAHGPTVPELTDETLMAITSLVDLKAAKSVDKTEAIGGDTLNYTVSVTNLGPGKATGVSVTDTLPDGTTQTRALDDLDKDASELLLFSYAVPCAAADGTLLTNQASVTGTDEAGFPDRNPLDNHAQASTTIHAPVLTLSKTATAAVNAGEAIVYTLTYENTGSGAGANVEITDILPEGLYYSNLLDQGTGPQPTSVTLNADGTRTLRWTIGAVPANSGPNSIVFTARSTLLALGGTSYNNSTTLSFQNDNGCSYAAVSAEASTSITVVPPTRNPGTIGFWRNHNEIWTDEILARIQATDQRYDTDANGALSVAEVTAWLSPGGDQPKVLQMQLLATYFNLATRRINAGTLIESKMADQLGLDNVAEAAIFAIDTLALPVNAANRPRYDNANKVLDEINNNKSEVYDGVLTSNAPTGESTNAADWVEQMYLPLIPR